MIYAVMTLALFVIPITAGAIAGARLSPEMCWLVLLGVLAVMVCVALSLIQLLPEGSITWLQDVAAYFALIVVFLYPVIIGEFFVGVRLGQEQRRSSELKLGSSTSAAKRSDP